VAQHTFLGVEGSVHRDRSSGAVAVNGFYVHPVTGLLCYAPIPDSDFAVGRSLKLKPLFARSASTHRTLRTSGVTVWTACAFGSAGTAAGSFTPTATCPNNSFASSPGAMGARCQSTARPGTNASQQNRRARRKSGKRDESWNAFLWLGHADSVRLKRARSVDIDHQKSWRCYGSNPITALLPTVGNSIGTGNTCVNALP
jgi:hypothetical protein